MAVTNVNPDTGIRYGIIALNSLTEEARERVLEGKDLSYAEMLQRTVREVTAELDDGAEEFAGGVQEEAARRLEDWECDEPDYAYSEGEPGSNTHLDVRTTWLGGAMLLIVLRSPHMTYRALCSPCVPNALDLDTPFDPHGWLGYDVPPEWRAEK